MFSLDNFYHVLYTNLIEPCSNVETRAYAPYEENKTLETVYSSKNVKSGKLMDYRSCVLFYDQEPLYQETLNLLVSPEVVHITPGYNYSKHDYRNELLYTKGRYIVANSEISDAKNKFITENGFLDWYYFSHGFLALDWYRDLKYVSINKSACFDKVFISYNHLTAKYRSYRLGFIADLIERGLSEYGLISFPLVDKFNGHFMNEILDKHSLLDIEHKKLAVKHLRKLDSSLIIDYKDIDGTFSANLNLEMNQRALWHIVTETNYYLPKLHLTEKIFKPIVSYRPFILAGAPGNLKYLRSYGFKTFSDFIDESYDSETDNTKRLYMIVDEIEKLCKLNPKQQQDMFEAMKPILEHNLTHFYGRFKNVIVDEMVYGWGECIDGIIDDSNIDYALVSQRLSQ